MSLSVPIEINSLNSSLRNERREQADDELEKDSEKDDNGIDDGLLPATPKRIFPNVNVYQHKKTVAQGMMDIALLSANANQLRYTLEMGWKHHYYVLNVSLISCSLILQIGVGVGLIWNGRYNVNKQKHFHRADRINNITIMCIFFITVLNLFIATFGALDFNSLDFPTKPQTGIDTVPQKLNANF